jgi:hypothetical protein
MRPLLALLLLAPLAALTAADKPKAAPQAQKKQAIVLVEKEAAAGKAKIDQGKKPTSNVMG